MRPLPLVLLGVGCASATPSLAVRAPSIEAGAPRTLAIVRIQPPWYAPRFLIRKKFVEAVPEYEAYEKLESKYFSIAADGRYGGLYLWATRGDAEAHFDEKWRRGVRERRGVEADVELVDLLYWVDGGARLGGERLGTRSLRADAVATWVKNSEDPEALARRLAAAPGLLRAAVARGAYLALWSDRSHALDEPGAVFFETPVLIDAGLR
ncbi:MAG: hypothetical protein QM723_09525 [Myxococcaceae bacterium]